MSEAAATGDVPVAGNPPDVDEVRELFPEHPELVRALVTSLGGPTSHTSIIARQRGIPCVVAAADLAALPGAVVLDLALG